MIRDFPLLSRNIFHAYADSDQADDTGDGRSWISAKKTIGAVINVLPEIAASHVIIHLKGVFDLTDYAVFGTSTFSGNNLNIIIDGGDEVTVLAGPNTATGGSTLSLQDSSQAWTTDEFQGYSVEILSGPLAGYMQTIDHNTDTELFISIPWPSSPGTEQYRITKPATTITSSSNRWLLYGGHHTYMLWFQRLCLTGNVRIGALAGSKLNLMWFGDVIFEDTAYISAYSSTNISWYKRDPANGASYMESTKVKKGVSFVGSNNAPLTAEGNIHYVYGPNCVLGTLEYRNSTVNVGSGRYRQFKFKNSVINSYSAASTSKCIISGSASSGIDSEDSVITLSHLATEIDNCSGHGIELKGSKIEVGAIAISGTGNGGVGIYAHANSHVQLEKANMPTITGTSGDVAVNNTTDPETWTDIEAADGLVSAQEGTRIDLV